MQADQFVVQLDGVERFDEQCVAAAAGPVHDAFDAPFAAGDDGHDKPVVPNRDELFLQQTVLAVLAQKALERILDELPLALDVAPQPAQGYAGMIGQRAVGKNLADDVLEHRAELADAHGARGHSRKPLAHRFKNHAHVGGAIEHLGQFVDLAAIQYRALNAQTPDRFANVWQHVETQVHRGTARGGLRLRRRAQVLHRLGHLGQILFQARAIGSRRDVFESGPAHRARNIAAQELLQRGEFQQIVSRVLHRFRISLWSFNALPIASATPSVRR